MVSNNKVLAVRIALMGIIFGGIALLSMGTPPNSLELNDAAILFTVGCAIVLLGIYCLMYIRDTGLITRLPREDNGDRKRLTWMTQMAVMFENEFTSLLKVIVSDELGDLKVETLTDKITKAMVSIGHQMSVATGNGSTVRPYARVTVTANPAVAEIVLHDRRTGQDETYSLDQSSTEPDKQAVKRRVRAHISRMAAHLS